MIVCGACWQVAVGSLKWKAPSLTLSLSRGRPFSKLDSCSWSYKVLDKFEICQILQSCVENTRVSLSITQL